jgi:UV DNA damage endonuclease
MTGRLGLCCMWDNDQTHPMRTITLASYKKAGSDGPLKLGEVSLHNLRMVRKLISLCGIRGWNYRIPQTVLPLLGMPGFELKMTDLPQWREILAEFDEIAAERGQVRLSMHPTAFCILGSESQKTVTAAISELELSARILDLCGAPRSYDAPINIHMNCSTGGPQATIKRFSDNFEKLSPSVRSRLVLENDDKGSWTTHALYQMGWTGPITFDYHHHLCNHGEHSEQEAFSLAMSTWGGHRPLFHYSEPDPNQTNIRAHCEMPTRRANDYGALFDLDIELKGKSKAIEAYASLK